MRRVLGLFLSLSALLLLTACNLKVPGQTTIRQAANPCTTLGPARLTRLAHAQGTVSQTPIPAFPQAQACQFKAAAGRPVIILGIFDSVDQSFRQEVVSTKGRYTAGQVHSLRVPGADHAAMMVAQLSGVRVPVLMASHDHFIYLVLAVTQVPAAAPRLERATAAALLRASH
jgi:hypothetical protein